MRPREQRRNYDPDALAAAGRSEDQDVRRSAVAEIEEPTPAAPYAKVNACPVREGFQNFRAFSDPA